MIVLDASASMDYQGENSDCSKFRYAQMLASCLLYLGHRQGDRIGLFGGSDHFQEWMFPRSGRESFKSILACVGGMKPRGVIWMIFYGINLRTSSLGRQPWW